MTGTAAPYQGGGSRRRARRGGRSARRSARSSMSSRRVCRWACRTNPKRTVNALPRRQLPVLRAQGHHVRRGTRTGRYLAASDKDEHGVVEYRRALMLGADSPGHSRAASNRHRRSTLVRDCQRQRNSDVAPVRSNGSGNSRWARFALAPRLRGEKASRERASPRFWGAVGCKPARVRDQSPSLLLTLKAICPRGHDSIRARD